MAHHVADDQRDPAAGQRDRVVPVAADPGRLGRREVARGEPDAGGLGEGVGQHRALQLVGDVRLAPVQHGLVDAERGVRRQLGGDQQITGLERGPLDAAYEDRRPDDPAPAAQRGEDRPVPGGDGPAGAQQLGQGGPRGRRVAEDRPHAAQHLGQRPVRPHLAQLGGRHQIGLRVEDQRTQPLRLGADRLRALLVADAQPVAAAQPQHERAHRALVAHRERIAQVDEDRVRERRHAGPAQPEDDLVEIDAPGDPSGRRADEAQPVALAAGGRLRVVDGGRRGGRARRGGRSGHRGGRGGGRGVLLPGPGALLRPGSERLPAFVGGGVLRHAWDSVRPGRLYEAVTSWGATVPRQAREEQRLSPDAPAEGAETERCGDGRDAAPPAEGAVSGQRTACMSPPPRGGPASARSARAVARGSVRPAW